jgi:hypothetical protein
MSNLISISGRLTDIPSVLRDYGPTSVANDYTVPGVNFWELSKCPQTGLKRFGFNAEREPTRYVVPHQHLGGLQFTVLAGTVVNQRFIRPVNKGTLACLWSVSRIKNSPKGVLRLDDGPVSEMVALDEEVYAIGKEFRLLYSEIHTIRYTKGSVVVFTEGLHQQDAVTILEPLDSMGNPIRMHEIEPWMFGRSKINV